ncbi:ATP-binding cassette domain-containing protein [Thermoflavimicrobium daqui]|uniref:ABC transporter domain-containing protein n=1 Tax=Thermoflavimicrobium daqui TaxID=2137476 RepID=A0A364K3A8_9BACL|nr:ABC transporter ATP-binding protein [Thermoflavimicrobium daqui]RAL23248.1 hypothetical protein DL897_12865 [Thermoflavimicrobium daqui]
MTTKASVIQIQQVSLSFPRFQLGPIDLSIEEGYVHALIGSNGAGKSTLLQTIMGLIIPDQGQISIFGMNYPHAEKEIKEQISYIPPEYLGPERWSAQKLANFYHKWYPNWDQQYFISLLEQFEISDREPYINLSTGSKRKLLFSLALACHTKLLLLDEPTNGYDFISRQIFYEQLLNWIQDGDRTAVIATHSSEEINKVADYITLMDRGMILGTFEKDTLIEQWRTIWLQKPLESTEDIPNIIRLDQSAPTSCLISSNAEKTLQALQTKNIPILKVTAMAIEDIITEITRKHRLIK